MTPNPAKTMRPLPKVWELALAMLIGVAGIITALRTVPAVAALLVPRGPLTDPLATPRDPAPKSPPDAEENEAIELFRTLRESVVNVDTLVRVQRFDRTITEQAAGTGSGFFWDDDGRVVTNFHVVQTAVLNNLSLRVVTADRTAYEAQVVGTAPDVDLAVLKITLPAGKAKKVAVGTSADLQVGQKVYAIGNPFGLSLTMTKGIISALDREITSPSDQTISGAIQTDAPINPGNSGGPLLDKTGRLIGVNTAIKTAGGSGNIGIGFAIPVDTVNAVVPELIRNQKLSRPDAGLTLLEERIVRRAGIREGVMIRDVEPDGPAAVAGLLGVRASPRTGEVLRGDLILSIDGEALRGNDDFLRRVRRAKIGQKLTLQVLRAAGGPIEEVNVTLRGI